MRRGIIFSLPFFLLYATGTAYGLTGQEIIQKVIDRDTPKTSRAKVKMILINKKGEKRTREILSYFKKYGKGSKSFIRFLAPPDVKGMGFLHWEQPGKDEQFIYLSLIHI